MRPTTHMILCIGLGILAALLISCSEERTTAAYQTHDKGWSDPNAPDFHGRVLAASCGTCHGGAYATDSASASCRECHTGQPMQLACTYCHGLPPVNDAGLPEGWMSGAAGAHAVHERYACMECHRTVTDLRHIDTLPAEVDFTEARIATVAPFTNPVYTHEGSLESGNGTCGSIYCHSDGRGGPPAHMAAWVGGTIGCTDCHAVPPVSHADFHELRCHICHLHVDSTSNYSYPDSIRFLPGLDSLHVNGVANVIWGG
jgi:predicted CxxxxCH...CXXCH cytochrome family protein